MNIGDTDKDGWTYVRFGDAAKAAQEGAHEVEARTEDDEIWFDATEYFGFYARKWQYRIRGKARTITVTIPRPSHQPSLGHELGEVTFNGASAVALPFPTRKERDAALASIRVAMEQS